MALPVPKRYIPVLSTIRNLPEPAANELLRVLRDAQIARTSEELYQAIAPQVPSIPGEQLKQILGFLYSVYHVRETSEMNRNDFLNELLETVESEAPPTSSEASVSAVRQRFKDLLDLKSLGTLSKAVRLQRDQERLYCEAKIISDIRPVFGDDVKSRPVAATITHSLQIGYHENDGDHKEFFIVLDDFDLNELEKVLQRAREKSDSLTQLLDDAGIPRLGI